MKKILINFYGKNNLGDDLFISILTNRYKNIFSIITYKTSKLFDTIDNLNVHRIPYRILLLSKLFERIINKRNTLLGIYLRKNDLLVYIGGSIFIEGDNLAKWKNDSDFYTKLTKPYYILGSNVGPYKSNEFIKTVGSIIGSAADTCFRDKASYDLYKNIDTERVASDIVFSLDTSKYEIKNEKIAIFSIINCDNRFDKNITDKYDQEIVNMTIRLVENDYKVVYMSFCKYEGDEIAIKRIMNKLDANFTNKVETFGYDGNLEEAVSLIARCEIIVATRFHATILGLLFSKKVLPMAYSQKTTNILNDLKFKGEIVDINNIDEFDGSKFNFNSLSITNVDEQIKLAELQFQELDKVLVKRK